MGEAEASPIAFFMNRVTVFFPLLLLGLLLSSCEKKAPFYDNPQQKAWLKAHWQRPLAPQGEKPPGQAFAQMDLSPQSCGACHGSQFVDWQGSRHAAAMGPGLLGQYLDSPGQGEQRQCMHCHAPLAEQIQGAEQGLASPGLHQQGLVCASCHLRQWKIFGPPQTKTATRSSKAHAGYEIRPEFENPNFCVTCHQFDAEGYQLNKKLLENTYEEWKASDYAENGITCQNCHMPGRRHLWRGIHDPDMVKAGLAVQWQGSSQEQGEVVANLILTNQGAGHALPTYVTPLLQLEFVQLDQAGQPLEATRQFAYIGRKVTLDLSQELYDTRLMPKQSREIEYRAGKAGSAQWLRVQLTVKPDEFYRQFYLASLRNPSLKEGRKWIQAALDQSIANEYLLWEKKVSLVP